MDNGSTLNVLAELISCLFNSVEVWTLTCGWKCLKLSTINNAILMMFLAFDWFSMFGVSSAMTQVQRATYHIHISILNSDAFQIINIKSISKHTLLQSIWVQCFIYWYLEFPWHVDTNIQRQTGNTISSYIGKLSVGILFPFSYFMMRNMIKFQQIDFIWLWAMTCEFECCIWHVSFD